VSEDWQAWADGCGEGAIHGLQGLKVDTAEMAIEAAVRGLGIAIGRRPFVDTELASGALVRFRNKEVVCDAGMWLVAPPETFKRADVQAFRDWLFQELRAFRQEAPHP
jgi:DNA-binding transcriptional LysR family regulator